MREDTVRKDEARLRPACDAPQLSLHDALAQIYRRTHEAAFEAEPQKQIPLRQTGGLLDVGEDECDFCGCRAAHSVPPECFVALGNPHAQNVLTHFASRLLEESIECLEQHPSPARSKVQVVRKFFGFAEAAIPHSLKKWVRLALIGRGEPRHPSKFFFKCEKIASAATPIFRQRLEAKLIESQARESFRGDQRPAVAATAPPGDFTAEQERPPLAAHNPASPTTASTGDLRTPSAERKSVNSFERRGDVWVITYDTETVFVPATENVGMQYIAILLRERLRPIEALRLEALSASKDSIGAPSTEMETDASGDRITGYERLDAKAREQCEKRCLALNDEIADARKLGDHERVEQLLGEMEAIKDQLAADTGRGGKPRKFSDDSEKARIRVTNAIRRAIKKIAVKGPKTAKHLKSSIATGITMMYLDGQTSWRA